MDMQNCFGTKWYIFCFVLQDFLAALPSCFHPSKVFARVYYFIASEDPPPLITSIRPLPHLFFFRRGHAHCGKSLVQSPSISHAFMEEARHLARYRGKRQVRSAAPEGTWGSCALKRGRPRGSTAFSCPLELSDVPLGIEKGLLFAPIYPAPGHGRMVP